jgi:hypothetical protein
VDPSGFEMVRITQDTKAPNAFQHPSRWFLQREHRRVRHSPESHADVANEGPNTQVQNSTAPENVGGGRGREKLGIENQEGGERREKREERGEKREGWSLFVRAGRVEQVSASGRCWSLAVLSLPTMRPRGVWVTDLGESEKNAVVIAPGRFYFVPILTLESDSIALDRDISPKETENRVCSTVLGVSQALSLAASDL